MERWHRVVVVAVALTLCTIAVAGVRDAEWERVRDAASRGLPRTAIRELQRIARLAARTQAYPEALRAVLQRIALESAIEGNKPEERIRRLRAEIPRAPRGTRPLLEALLARYYRQYFEENRWRFMQRTRTASSPSDDFTTWDLPRLYAEVAAHYRRALAAEALLKRTPIAAYDDLLERGNVPDAYRPTLYDFVAFEALDFYASGEQAGARPEDAFQISADGPVFAPAEEFVRWRVATSDSTSPAYRALRLYQDLLRFHAADHDPSARLDADLSRLRFGWNQAAGAAKAARYKAALERLVSRHDDHPLSTLALGQWASLLLAEGDRAGAWRLARRGASRFPESDGGRICYNLIRQIEAALLSISTERVWNAPLPAIEIRYRNLDRVHFRVVPFDFEAWVVSRRYAPEHPDPESLRGLLARGPILEWSETLPPTPDFAEREQRLAAPRGLAPGPYYLIASDDGAFSMTGHVVQVTIFWVSDLALVLRGQSRGGIEGFVLDARTGDPVPGAAIQAWSRDPRRAPRDPEATATDGNGRFRLAGRSNACVVLATRGSQRIASLDDYWAGHPSDPEPFQRTLIFTDRVLYRPGQTIRYKGISIRVDQHRDDYEVLPGIEATMVLRDPNGREVARARHVTNDLGSFSGSFNAPETGLRGIMNLAVEGAAGGYASVSVEEYKRPRFTAALEAPKPAARLGSEVIITGRASAYTGAAVDGAKVVWRVTRQVSYPVWCRWRWDDYEAPRSGPQEIARGTTTTATDGTFAVRFSARPDSSAGAERQPTFVFSVHADVTDPAGETRSADRVVRVGHVALTATLSADEWQTPAHPVEIAVHTTTLDGVPAAASGELSVYALRQPARIVRASLARGGYWQRRVAAGADAAGDSIGPDPATWPEDRVVSRREISTDTTGVTHVTVALPAGVYRARLETRDRFGRPVRTEMPLRVLDPAAPRCPIRVADLLAAPRWSVEPGEEFVAVWGSGYDRARAFVEVEHRGRMLQAFWTHPGATQNAFRQRVTEAMRGGFTVRVTMVRENRAYLHETIVQVPWTNKQLPIRWEHFVSKLEPGQRETWTAVVGGRDATRVAAEMVATLYDASLDAFRASGWPGGFGVFRQEQPVRRAQFQNAGAFLAHAGGSWPMDQKSVVTTYRAFPDEILWDWYEQGGALWGKGWKPGRSPGISVRARRRIDTRSSATQRSIGVGALGEIIQVQEEKAISVRGGRGNEMIPVEEGLVQADRPTDAAGEPVSVSAQERAPAPDLSRVTPRRNLEETAFFFPHLIANDRGEVRIEFTMPEALTEWRFLGFAHDRALRAGLIEARAVTSRDLMVQPNPPRFLREGDVLEMTVKVTNRTDARLAGRVRLTLSDALGGGSADAALGNRAPERDLDLPPRESRTYAWRLAVPDGAPPLVFKAVASSGRQSDGEEGVLPVLSRRILVTESLPLPIRGPASRAFDFARLARAGESGTLRHQSLTVQMTSHPAWYAVMALPYLMESPYECTDQTFNRLYANALARHVAASDPRIRRVFDRWRATPALDSPLEKNQSLKAVTIEETPWLRQAEAESQARRNVGILFDSNRLDDETARLEQRLAQLQLPDGAWPWFPGGRGDDYITLYITTGFGRLRHLGVNVGMGSAMRALERLDGWVDATYRDILLHQSREANHLSPIIVLYLYGRSFFLAERAPAGPAKEAVDYFLGQARRYWLALPNRQSQAQLALALARFGDEPTARAVLRSLRERAVRSEELGMFWRDEERSWWWYRAPIETQAVTIEAFDEVGRDAEAVEECRVWLLKQKQTQDWKTSPATADAVYALLLRGRDLLSSDALVEVALGGRPIQPESVEAGTGFYERRFAGSEVTPAMARVTVSKRDSGVAWGSVHWQYLEDMSRVTPYAGTPLTLRKTLFVRVNGPRGPELRPVAGAVRVGDPLVVRIELRVDRDMEYVHLKDDRASGVEPTNVLSGWRYQDGLAYYEETRDAASHFFIAYLPKGTYVFEYPARVQHRGRYQSGMARIQCMYAPEFGGHSGSVELEVR